MDNPNERKVTLILFKLSQYPLVGGNEYNF